MSLLRLQNANPFFSQKKSRVTKEVKQMAEEIRKQDINRDIEMFTLGTVKNRPTVHCVLVDDSL